jgi:hypothetical protein
LVSLFRTNNPVIARVNGHAMGGGLGLVAASTFAVASTDAKLGTPEVDVGLFPFMIFAVLERIMMRRRLMEMVLFGQKLTAAEAAAAGLVNVAVAPPDLDAAVAEYAGKIAEKSPIALRLGLEALRDTDGLGLTEKVPALSERLMACLGTEDAREGLTAFLEKRAPKSGAVAFARWGAPTRSTSSTPAASSRHASASPSSSTTACSSRWAFTADRWAASTSATSPPTPWFRVSARWMVGWCAPRPTTSPSRAGASVRSVKKK